MEDMTNLSRCFRSREQSVAVWRFRARDSERKKWKKYILELNQQEMETNVSAS
jgi:hypothetical protein